MKGATILFSLISIIVLLALVLTAFLASNVESQISSAPPSANKGTCDAVNWTCPSFSPCVNGTQTRDCTATFRVPIPLAGSTTSPPWKTFHQSCTQISAQLTNQPPILTQACGQPTPSPSPLVLVAPTPQPTANQPLPPPPTQLIGTSTVFNSLCGDKRLPSNCTGFMPFGASLGWNVPIPVDVPGIIKLACQRANGDWDFQYGCNYKHSPLNYVGRVKQTQGNLGAQLQNSVTRKGATVPGTTPPKLQAKSVINEFGENGTIYSRVGLDLQGGCHGTLNDDGFENYCLEHGAQLVKEDCGPIDVGQVETCTYEYFTTFRPKVGGLPEHPFQPAKENANSPYCGYAGQKPGKLGYQLRPQSVCEGFSLEYLINDPSISWADRSTCDDLGINVQTKRVAGSSFINTNNFLITGPRPYEQTPNNYDPSYTSATFGSVGTQITHSGTRIKCIAKSYYYTPLTGFACPTTNKITDFDNPGYDNAYKGTVGFPTTKRKSLVQDKGIFPFKENVKGGRYSCQWSIPVISKIEMKVNNRKVPASLDLQWGDNVTISGEIYEQQNDDVVVALSGDVNSFDKCNFGDQSGCIAFTKVTNTKTPQKFELNYIVPRVIPANPVGLITVDQNEDEDPIIFRIDVSVPPDCTDGIINVNETEAADWVNYNTDCGGSQSSFAATQPQFATASCPRCQDSRLCRENSDCRSAVCQANSTGQKICVSCNDGTQNQDETDMDCGGSCSALNLFCLNGQKCLIAGDCLPTSFCDNSTGQKICATKPVIAVQGAGCQGAWQCAPVGNCNPTTKLQNQICVQTNVGACPVPINPPPAAQIPCQVVAPAAQLPPQLQQCITCSLSSCSLQKPNGQLGLYQLADQNCQTKQLPGGCAGLPVDQLKFIMGTATPCTQLSAASQSANAVSSNTSSLTQKKQEFQDWLSKFGFIPAKSTDFTLLANLDAVLLKLCNSDGCIQYVEPVNLTTITPQQLYQAIVISRGVVVVDSVSYPVLNKPVIITLNGIFLKDIAVALNGVCTEAYELVSYNPTTGELIFKVSHLSAWSSVDQKTGCATGAVIADAGIYPPIVWILVAIAAALLIVTFLTRGRSKTLYEIEEEELGREKQ